MVCPARGQVLSRQLDLILAKRFAANLGSELALVTLDDNVRFNAQQLGIRAFSDIRHAQELEWRIIEPRKLENQPRTHLTGLDNLRKSIRSQAPVWMEQPAARIICLGVSLLALLALAIFFLPDAKVILTAREQMQSLKLDLIADPSATTANISTGSVPTYFQEATVEGTDSITATGTMTIPDQPAAGILKFTNRTEDKITIPTGTIITALGSDRVRFATTSPDEVVIEANKSTFVEVQAIRPGSSGNLPPNSLVAIEGDLGLKLAVTNPDATSGGLDASIPTSTAQDLQTLHAQLARKLLQESLAELKSNLPVEDTLIPSSSAIMNVLEETYNPAFGVPTEQVELVLRLKIKVQVISGKVLRNIVTPILDASIPAGYTPEINTLTITSLSTPNQGSDGKAYWTVNVSRKLLAELPADQAVESIKGATPTEAVERLSKLLPLAKRAQIKLIPSWWPRLPLLAMRITLVQAGTQ